MNSDLSKTWRKPILVLSRFAIFTHLFEIILRPTLRLLHLFVSLKMGISTCGSVKALPNRILCASFVPAEL